MRQRPFLVAGLALALLCLTALATSAQDGVKPPSAFGPKSGAATTQSAPPSAFAPPAAMQQPQSGGGPFGLVLRMQQNLQRDLAVSVRNLKSEHALTGAIMLAALSFFYGVVHAVGPGHGKAIISSYVVANEETVRRGIFISFMAAGLQALTAIALVGILALALNTTGLEINAWSNQLERVSYALIALVGAWLLISQIARLFRGWRHSHAEPASLSAASARSHHHLHHHDHHDHGHAEGEACSHMVDAKSVAGPFSWRKALAVVISVGVRPCTGAILVLVFALTQGLFWAGVAATFAMALGTAITVAVLASLALGSRELDGLRRWRLGADIPPRRDTVRRLARSGAAVLSTPKLREG
jgi:nickel/cobalt exporter